MALTMSARLTMPTILASFITGTRLILCVFMSWAISSTVVSSGTLITFLLMIDLTSLPFLARISASETIPMILPFLPATGAPLSWFLISVLASNLTVIVGATVIMSLVMISLAIIDDLLKTLFGDQCCKISDPAAIAPFVVIPRQHLSHLVVEYDLSLIHISEPTRL